MIHYILFSLSSLSLSLSQHNFNLNICYIIEVESQSMMALVRSGYTFFYRFSSVDLKCLHPLPY